MTRSEFVSKPLVVPEAASMLGPINAFASACFFVFGVIYLVWVNSWYMFVSNFCFGILGGVNWLVFRKSSRQGLRVASMLTGVYVGLVNVAAHLGVGPLPMVFWGMSISIAGVFLFNPRGIMLWIGLGLAFYPITSWLKNGPLAARVIPLDAFQTSLLSSATYVGLLIFLAYAFMLFRLRLDKAIVSRDQHRDALRSSEIQHVTDLQLAEQERRQLEGRLFQSQKLESLGVLAGGVAHDFNNLLTGILGNLSFATDSKSLGNSLEREEALKSAETAALRAAELTRQMLAFAGQGRFDMKPLDLNEILREMVDLLKSSVSRLVLLKFDLDSRAPWITGDASQVRQIILNLIINAAEAIGDQSGVITLRTTVIEPKSSELTMGYAAKALPAGLYACLEVIDTGCGMDETVRSRIFDPFYTTKFTGRGLGLAGVIGILKGHHGGIWVTSTPGKGSTFRVAFPLGTPVFGAVAPSSSIQASKGSGLVLVIDDEEVVRKLVRRVLENSGFEVIEASDGIDGVKQFCGRTAEVSLVMLDLTMPGQGGVATFKELRSIRPDVPVVLMSGYVKENVEALFSKARPQAFLEKPFRPVDILRALKDARVLA